MRKLLALSFLLLVWPVFTLYFGAQFRRGGYAYQVHDGRLKWCIVVCLPGEEEFYDHTSHSVGCEFNLFCRYRISPWFDAGRSTTPFDNP